MHAIFRDQYTKMDVLLANKILQDFILTHWGRVTHICVSKLTIIGSDNGLSPGRRQAIIRTNAGISLIGRLGTNFNAILIENHIISFKKIHLKMSSGNGGHFVSASMCFKTDFGQVGYPSVIDSSLHHTQLIWSYMSRLCNDHILITCNSIPGMGRQV